MTEIAFKEIKLRATIVLKSASGITLDDALTKVRSLELIGSAESKGDPEIIIANCHRVYEVPED